MKKVIVFLVSLLPFGCSEFLGIDSKPDLTEREVTFNIILKDNSGYMKKLFGDDFVRNAMINLKSNLLGKEYKLVTDSTGLAKIDGIISDKYLITAIREMTPEEMLIISGSAVPDIRLTNKNMRIIELNAASTQTIFIDMEVSAGNSPVIISEIYACGPSGAGLYYHDKYIELFNNSDSVFYLDGVMVAVVYVYSPTWTHYRDDPEFIHSKNIWIFPGNGTDYPIQPGQFVLCVEDAIDHRVNAPNSVDLSHADFEFYKDDAPDIDNPAIPNMLRIYQPSGNDWLIPGEKGALVIAKFPADSLIPFDDQFLIPYRSVLDGVEYSDDPTQLDKKTLNEGIDASLTGGIQFYTGKSMERILESNNGRLKLKDENNSSVDFMIISPPSPGKYHQL